MAAMPSGYLARETVISAIINGVLSAGIFAAMFRRIPDVPVWGLGQLAFDFIPQSFMVALMGAMVPGLLARRRMASLKQSAPRLVRIVGLAVIAALAAVVVGAGAMALLFAGLGLDDVPFATGLVLKVVYGVMLSLIVTPTILRRLWS